MKFFSYSFPVILFTSGISYLNNVTGIYSLALQTKGAVRTSM